MQETMLSSLLGKEFQFVGFAHKDAFQFTFYRREGTFVICLSQVTAQQKIEFAPILEQKLGFWFGGESIVEFAKRQMEGVTYAQFRSIMNRVVDGIKWHED